MPLLEGTSELTSTKPILSQFWSRYIWLVLLYATTCLYFSNTFSLYKLMFLLFLSGGVQQMAKNFTFCWFWLGKIHRNGLSGAYIWFQACTIQWCMFQVSTISSFWKKIKISGKDFTFCWFWLGEMHQNGLSGVYLGFKAWHSFQISTISGSWKIKFKDTSSIKWDSKPSKWNGTHAAVLLVSHSTLTPCFRTLCLNFPVKNQGKPS